MEAEETRHAYVERFRVLAHGEIAGLFVPGSIAGLTGGHLDRFALTEKGEEVHAETAFSYGGLRFRYVRRIWPPDFPLEIKVSLYVEHLRERVLTRRYTAEADGGTTVDL
ncbi:hypothetical protein G3I19_25810 [Streptomyces sp. SID10853]|uniref:hypothetical protein n=1 Tax=Streptomyces sp. SID10853 TaxID=2706028 RepID=UPI0013C18BB1|nr:hypothetical protein [Streptomyces sp. SID10853]NDZ81887.1 hypothetical protein [Streptomyces sp. SID10853]